MSHRITPRGAARGEDDGGGKRRDVVSFFLRIVRFAKQVCELRLGAEREPVFKSGWEGGVHVVEELRCLRRRRAFVGRHDGEHEALGHENVCSARIGEADRGTGDIYQKGK